MVVRFQLSMRIPLFNTTLLGVLNPITRAFDSISCDTKRTGYARGVNHVGTSRARRNQPTDAHTP